jgi:hypothetical protein
VEIRQDKHWYTSAAYLVRIILTVQTTDAATVGGYPLELSKTWESEEAYSIPWAITIICFENCKGTRTTSEGWFDKTVASRAVSDSQVRKDKAGKMSAVFEFV